MKQVRVFKTSDGKLFEEFSVALEHEMGRKMEELFPELTREQCRWIVERRSQLQAIFNMEVSDAKA